MHEISEFLRGVATAVAGQISSVYRQVADVPGIKLLENVTVIIFMCLFACVFGLAVVNLAKEIRNQKK